MIDDFEYMSDSESEGLCLENLPSSRSMGDLSSVEIDYLNEVKDNKGAYESRLEELGINNIENVSHSSDFIENYDDNLPSLDDVKEIVNNGQEITDLKESYPEIAQYVACLQDRLDNNDYALSIKAYKSENGTIVLKGFDEGPNEQSNYAVIKGQDIYCYSGNAKGDGHLNEFINNTDGMIPNSRYHLENATYVTDNLGRVSDTYEHHVTERPIDRNDSRCELKSVADAKDGLPNDVGGHIVAHNVDGATEAINIVAMDEEFNNCGEWKSMESDIQDAYMNHVDCYVHKHLEYDGNTQRPSHIDVQYEIGGVTSNKSFNMPYGGSMSCECE